MRSPRTPVVYNFPGAVVPVDELVAAIDRSGRRRRSTGAGAAAVPGGARGGRASNVSLGPLTAHGARRRRGENGFAAVPRPVEALWHAATGAPALAPRPRRLHGRGPRARQRSATWVGSTAATSPPRNSNHRPQHGVERARHVAHAHRARTARRRRSCTRSRASSRRGHRLAQRSCSKSSGSVITSANMPPCETPASSAHPYARDGTATSPTAR